MHTILSISDSDKHFASAIQEYTKRLGKFIQIKNVKPIKNGSQEHVIQKETDTLIEILEKKYTQYNKILLSKEGKILDTFEFKTAAEKKNHTVWIIGGPYGVDEQRITSHIDQKVSFGKITLPHGLAKLTLLEQIYRSETIKIGKKYHY